MDLLAGYLRSLPSMTRICTGGADMTVPVHQGLTLSLRQRDRLGASGSEGYSSLTGRGPVLPRKPVPLLMMKTF